VISQAAAGWPLSELFDRKIANLVGLTPVVDATDRAPSILNGGLGKISPFYWIACLLVAGAIDVYGINQAKNTNYFPGNLGFDPLGLYPKDQAGQDRMQLAEIKNGRLGMIAITAFAVQEWVYSLGVVDETPIFFKPIGGVLREYANSGYIQ
jgi:Chlorophyll A-B binding protein